MQIFCDKGAERKARDEERRAQKRRATNSGQVSPILQDNSFSAALAVAPLPPISFTLPSNTFRDFSRPFILSRKRRLDELYHTAHERSDFYSMADIHKPPILFTPTQDPDKAAIDFGTELPRFVYVGYLHISVSTPTVADIAHTACHRLTSSKSRNLRFNGIHTSRDVQNG